MCRAKIKWIQAKVGKQKSKDDNAESQVVLDQPGALEVDTANIEIGDEDKSKSINQSQLHAAVATENKPSKVETQEATERTAVTLESADPKPQYPEKSKLAPSEAIATGHSTAIALK